MFPLVLSRELILQLWQLPVMTAMRNQPKQHFRLSLHLYFRNLETGIPINCLQAVDTRKRNLAIHDSTDLFFIYVYRIPHIITSVSLNWMEQVQMCSSPAAESWSIGVTWIRGSHRIPECIWTWTQTMKTTVENPQGRRPLHKNTFRECNMWNDTGGTEVIH